MNNKLYDKLCYKKMFMLKGNYDEALARSSTQRQGQHKMKWLANEGTIRGPLGLPPCVASPSSPREI